MCTAPASSRDYLHVRVGKGISNVCGRDDNPLESEESETPGDDATEGFHDPLISFPGEDTGIINGEFIPLQDPALQAVQI